MLPFSAPTRAWFEAGFAAPTPVQERGWAAIAQGHHSLLLAPTGSGKTLAAFLWSIDRCTQPRAEVPGGVRVLYVSPLKALVYDVERNLRAPLVGIERAASRLDAPFRRPRVGIRTGDTPQKERRDHLRDPAEILVTTPESLYLLLGSQARETLRTVETVIVDEIHALAPSKRGVHLALSLERLSALTARDPQRIGLSATARPLAAVAAFLGGDRPVEIVDTSTAPNLAIRIVVPVADMERPEPSPAPGPEVRPRGGPLLADAVRSDGGSRRPGMWPSLYDRLLDEIERHRTTIVFVNSRGLCERLAQRLNDLHAERERRRRDEEQDGDGAADEATPDLVRTHHGSLSHVRRKDTEELLKEGRIRGIVATSSLELGIDMASVDHVILVESPGSVASGLQRVGRAGHGVGETSRGTLYPKHRGDLLEATVIAARMRQGEIEPLHIPRRCLDVLAQQIVAMVAAETWSLTDLEACVKRAAGFRDLSRDALVAVLDMLSGRYPSNEFADLRPRIVWDRTTDELSARRGAGMVAIMSGGTIPDRGLYTVHLGPTGPRVGELDEEMVHESRAGHVVALGATSWRILEITRDRVIVEPAPGQAARLPFWKGEGPGRPLELGRAIGAFLRELAGRSGEDARGWLRTDYDLDGFAADNLVRYVHDQREATGSVPTDRDVTIERFRDEVGDWRICILTPFGSRVHAPWALALENRLAVGAGFEVQTLWSDDGIVLRFVDTEESIGADTLIPDPDEVEDHVVEQLGHAALFAASFRENAARALLLPRRRPGARTPLWSQRLKAQNLLAIARDYPSFPIVLETYRTCLQDVFDVPALVAVLRAIRAREIAVHEVDTREASPFARSLVFAFTAAYLYEGDAPLAERRAQALSLDRGMLRELLGHEELRSLLDLAVVDAVEAELQRLDEAWQARHADDLHDVLRQIGDLTPAEATLRSRSDPGPWLDELERSGRALRVRVAGENRWIAVEDAALYRDALGVSLPTGVAGVWLGETSGPLRTLIRRWGRTHGPFLARDVAGRLGLAARDVEPLLVDLDGESLLLRGDFRPGGFEPEWCDPDVLRQLRQRTLAHLRNEVAPVDAAVFARFLGSWHGLNGARRGTGRLEEALAQLEGLPLSFSDLERAILPSRLPEFHSRQLDDALGSGLFVWIGEGAAGKTDGRISIYRRQQVALLREPPVVPDGLDELPARALAFLEARGASFFAEVWSALRPARRDEVEEALWDLAWRGLVTNDTLDVLRRRGRASKSRRASVQTPPGGRWSLVSQLWFGEITDTERAHARAVLLLERHGVVGRASVAAEAFPGGFAAVYPVLRAMEDAGKARRGWFVDGLGGAQFAFPGAVDRLRAARRPAEETIAHGLAATDPANPFGSVLPWPAPTAGESAALRRAPGARVVLVDGEVGLYATKGGRAVLTFAPVADLDRAALVVQAFHDASRRGMGRAFRIETIDGEPARSSPLLDTFQKAGFSADHRALWAD